MLGRTDSRLRMVAILLIFAVFGSAAGLRLGYWQVLAAPELTEQAVRSMTPAKVTHVARAEIVDRDGKVIAQTASLDRLDAHPRDIRPEDRAQIITVLGDILDLDAKERESYAETLSSDKAWDWLERRLSLKQSAAIRLARDKGDLPGISLAPQDVRVYPRKGGQTGTTLASHLLGFVRADNRGGSGVELLYDDRLMRVAEEDVDVASVVGIPGGLDGLDARSLELTIDAALQRQLEKELNTARIANQAKSASAIIMDPHTGAILASASVPGYDANDFARVARDSEKRLRDPVVSNIFEPGSVMKIFTVTAALESNVVTPQTKIRDENQIEFYKYTVRNSDHKALGTLTVKDVIARSRNVATAKIAQRLAPRSTQAAARRLFDLWQKVGMTDKTGVDIGAEEAGTWYDPDEKDWAAVDLANRAFGQGIAVTLVQLATGFSTIVNGGYRVQPHVVADSDIADVPRQRVLKAKVARQGRDILMHVTGSVPWYAKGSLISGYMIGGKTGTAQIWDSRRGDWKKDRFNHNFVGFVGGNKPEAVIAVRIEEPKPKIKGQGIIQLKIESYELFQMIARGAIRHLDIRKSRDPDAGKPIIGTDAARVLTPDRNRQAKQRDKRKARKEAAKAVSSEKSARKNKSNKGESNKNKTTKPASAESGASARAGGQTARSSGGTDA
jgi:cell division protein FtsI (penicillin-binding protein 3)